jgi:DNA-binding IclR family transcriptional regulator
MAAQQARGGVRALKRGLELLGHVIDAPEPIGVAELSRAMGLHKATVSRLLHTLAEEGYASVDQATGRYLPGLEAVRRMRASSVESVIIHKARPMMTTMREASGETVGLYVPVWPDRVCVDYVNSTSGLRRQHQIGERWSLTAGAPGLAYLAFVDEDELARTIEARGLSRLTEYSIVDVDAYKRALEQVRRDGYAVSLSLTIDGMNGVAAPIFGSAARPVAIISVAGPSQRFDVAAIAAFAPLLRQATRAVSHALGATGKGVAEPGFAKPEG